MQIQMTRRLARTKFYDITSAQEEGLHALVCGCRGCWQKLAIQQKMEHWQFNRKLNTGNSTKVEIQQNWKLKISSGVSYWPISPHPFHKSGMALSVYSLCASGNLLNHSLNACNLVTAVLFRLATTLPTLCPRLYFPHYILDLNRNVVIWPG